MNTIIIIPDIEFLLIKLIPLTKGKMESNIEVIQTRISYMEEDILEFTFMIYGTHINWIKCIKDKLN